MMIAGISSATTKLEDNEKYHSRSKGHSIHRNITKTYVKEKGKRPLLWEPWTK